MVDDEPLVAMVVAEQLRDIGVADVLEAGSGFEALRMIERHPQIDVMLSDIRMPWMDGTELARKAAAARPQLKIALVTGFAAGHDTAGLPVLEKPIGTSALLRLMYRLLGH